ncbi:MAG: DUF47 family protein [Clostridia bacterium]|nr:DUF47 family protein [Clostridia bacterium]
MKKEELNYYDEFINMSKCAIDISKTFRKLVESYTYDESREQEKKVHEKEREADKTQHKILNYLIKDFVPPIEREDIITLTRRLDDVVDNIDEVMIDFDILAIKEMRPNIGKYVDLMEVATNKMSELLVAFKDMKNYDEVQKICVALNGMEEQGDKLYQESLRDLYTNETDAVEVIRWTAIYNKLEDCFDSVEHVAEYVDAAFMKNA